MSTTRSTIKTKRTSTVWHYSCWQYTQTGLSLILIHEGVGAFINQHSDDSSPERRSSQAATAGAPKEDGMLFCNARYVARSEEGKRVVPGGVHWPTVQRNA
jgi:hypothetical protein